MKFNKKIKRIAFSLVVILSLDVALPTTVSAATEASNNQINVSNSESIALNKNNPANYGATNLFESKVMASITSPNAGLATPSTAASGGGGIAGLIGGLGIIFSRNRSKNSKKYKPRKRHPHKAAEHTKNASPSKHDKHTKRRSGSSPDKKKKNGRYH